MRAPAKTQLGLLLLFLALTAPAIGLTYSRLQQAQANPGPTMGVDPDRGGAQPVGGTKALSVGQAPQIGLHATAPAALALVRRVPSKTTPARPISWPAAQIT